MQHACLNIFVFIYFLTFGSVPAKRYRSKIDFSLLRYTFTVKRNDIKLSLTGISVLLNCGKIVIDHYVGFYLEEALDADTPCTV